MAQIESRLARKKLGGTIYLYCRHARQSTSEGVDVQLKTRLMITKRNARSSYLTVIQPWPEAHFEPIPILKRGPLKRFCAN